MFPSPVSSRRVFSPQAMEEPVNVDCIQTTEESVGELFVFESSHVPDACSSSISSSGLRLRYKSWVSEDIWLVHNVVCTFFLPSPSLRS